MIRGRLILDGTPEEIDAAMRAIEDGHSAQVLVDLASVDLGAEGELVRHDLRPTGVLVTNEFAVADPSLPPRERQKQIAKAERTGPLVFVYVTRPTEESNGSRNDGPADAGRAGSGG